MKTSEINLRDPFVLAEGGKYYLYGTRGATCWGSADGFDVYVSEDLAAWRGPVEIFHNDGSFWADRNYWAPECHPWRGAYYLFASFKAEGVHRGTAILRADSPEGPFVPWSDGPVTPSGWECLDGTLHVDAAGRPWMVFCHEWVQVGDGEIRALPLTEDLKGAAGEPLLLFTASQAAWARPVHHSSGVDGYVTDGPYVHRTSRGELLMLWASFSEGGYTEGLARSTTGDITGPWEQLPPLFEKDGGHGMLFRAKDGRLMLTLHSPNQHLLERPVFVDVTDKLGE